MEPENWPRVDRILAATLNRPPTLRDDYVREACGGDRELECEVFALLRAEGRAEDFLERPIVRFTDRPREDGPPDPDRLGPYRLVEVLGEGGMSTVYRARRDDGHFQQDVAIKIIRGDLSSDDHVRRFRMERQLLARLQHPNIARLLDGGATASGRPYLVMELIDGVPIDRYCDQNHLSVDQRLELFRRVCAAVNAAHQNLLVHRDLKPGNILVDTGGEPRLLDFGIAKLLAPREPLSLQDPTRSCDRPMTLSHASPEQVRREAITTASDVYSLGVVLFTLLTGRLPYRLPERPFSHQIERAICELPPERPSAAVDDRELRKHLRGDLDSIVLKALAKTPSERYDSAKELADDLERHLGRRPVQARSPTWPYRAMKMIRRKPLAVASGVLTLVLLLTFTGVVGFQAKQLARQRDAAETARRGAQETADFLLSLFQSAHPARGPAEQLTLRDLLDQGVRDLDHLEGQPGLEATYLMAIAQAYRGLGLLEQAEPLYERALELRLQTLGRKHLDTVDSLHGLAQLRQDQGDLEAARPLLEEALATLVELRGDDHADLYPLIHDLAYQYQLEGDYPSAEQRYREALERMRSQAVSGEPEVIALQNLGGVLRSQGRLDEAREVYSEALALARRELGSGHPYLATVLGNLGELLRQEGDLDGAEALFLEAYEIRRKAFGDEHPDLAVSLTHLAALAQARGDLEGAEQRFRQALAIRRSYFGDRHPMVSASLNNLATLLDDKGDLQEAEALYREALEVKRRIFEGDHPSIAINLHNLGLVYYQQGELETARAVLEEAVEMRERLAGPEAVGVALERVDIAQVLLKAGRPEEAGPLLDQALPIVRKSLPEDHPRRAFAECVLGAYLSARGELDEAEPYLLQGLETVRERLGDSAFRTRAAAEWVAVHRERRGGTADRTAR
jgi:tetratricopeptide (TPR) repeat protein